MSELRKSTASAPERLRLLLPWLNGDKMAAQELQIRLLGFVGSFDGSATAGHIEVRIERLVERLDESPALPTTAPLAAQLETLRLVLRSILQADDVPEVRSFPSLRFGARRVRQPAKRSQLRTAKERVAYEDAGATVLRVEGGLIDLVPFLLMHLLTAPDMMTIARCPAPQAGHWKERCGRWFLRAAVVGRPKEFCSDRCRVRAHYVKPR